MGIQRLQSERAAEPAAFGSALEREPELVTTRGGALWVGELRGRTNCHLASAALTLSSAAFVVPAL